MSEEFPKVPILEPPLKSHISVEAFVFLCQQEPVDWQAREAEAASLK
jgi:hypothetical protein